jgi:ABC-2 type transport system permease protein
MKNILSKRNRALLSELVRTDFKLRYQGSVLGYAWTLLRPLLIFTILYIVFIKFLKVNYGVPHSAVYLLVGIILWNFFLEITSGSVGAIVARGDLIRKIRIPRWMIIISTSFSAVINLLLNCVIIGLFMALNHVSVGIDMLWFPLILIELYIFGLGIAFFLSTAFVRYRDISYIWEVICQMLFYLTPILYPISKLKMPIVVKLLFISPLTQIIQATRYVLVTNNTFTLKDASSSKLLYIAPFLIVILVFVFGIYYFKLRSKTFAEDV